jgi:ribose/xylose/arabinose/galactoside ABC-type transport system permease subunit
MDTGAGTKVEPAGGGGPGLGPTEQGGRPRGPREAASKPVAPSGPPRWHAALRLNEIGVIVAAVLVFGVFSIVAPPFLTLDSWGGILSAASEYGLVATGVTLLMVAGEFDLTVGVVFALTPMVAGYLLVNLGWNPWLAFVIGELAAVGVGLVNGLLTNLLRIPSFIVTLAVYYLLQGVTLNMTGGYPISYFGHSHLFKIIGGTYFGSTGISVSVFWWLGVAAIGAFVLSRTRFGDFIFASGSDPRAARSMGVPVRRTKLICFVLSAMGAGLAGLTQFGALGTVDPSQGGDLQLVAIVVAVVGGTSLFGGRGSVLGSTLGALIIAAAYTGLIEAGLSATWFESFIGAVLLLAVVIVVFSEGARARLGGVIR